MNHPHHHKSVHQHVEQFLRHRIILAVVLVCMFLTVLSTDTRFREVMRSAYSQGWGFIGTYFHHEHPSHQHNSIAIARIPTVTSF